MKEGHGTGKGEEGKGLRDGKGKGGT